MSQYDDIREAAESYLNFDLPIIPLCSHNHRGCSDKHKERCKTPGKAPILKDWSNHHDTTYEELEEWFSRNKYINLGLVLGQTENWNLVGVDIDGELGETVWTKLSKDRSQPETWEFRTGGGRRLLYMLPEGLVTKKNKVEYAIGHEELAFIAQGQQTVLPPSVHPSGKQYEWIKSPFEVDIAMAPDWIIDLVKVESKTRAGAEDLPNFYGEEQSVPVVLEENEQTIRDGSRSDKMARFVGSLCAKRNLPKATVLETSLAQNKLYCNPPLDENEIIAMVESIFNSEQKKHQKIVAQQRKRRELHPAALAEMFITKQNNQGIFYKYFQERGKLYYTDTTKGPWIMLTDEQIKADIHSFLLEQDATLATTAKCVEIQQQIIIDCTKQSKDGSELDMGRNPVLDKICLQNGVLEWETGKLLPWDKEFNLTVQISAKYMENVQETEAYKVWNEGLHSWIPDESTIEFLQEYIGYALIPTCKMRTAVFLDGGGSNGKSLFIEAIQLLFENSYHVTQPSALASRFGTTAIVDKLLLVCSDIDSTYLDHTGTLKQIIAGDEIRAEYKGGKEFNVKPIGKMLFSANKLPMSGDKSHGWYSRLQIVNFPHKFKKDLKYYEHFMSVMKTDEGRSVLLSWAVEGLKRLWANNQFTKSEAMDTALKNYKKDNDNVLSFAMDYLTPSDGTGTQADNALQVKLVYMVYKDWCDDVGMKPASQTVFASRVCSAGFTKGPVKMKVNGAWKSQQCFKNCKFAEGTEYDMKSEYNSYAALTKIG